MFNVCLNVLQLAYVYDRMMQSQPILGIEV